MACILEMAGAQIRAAIGLRPERSNTQLRCLVVGVSLWRGWNGIENDNFFQLGAGNSVKTGTGKESMTGKGPL